MTSKFITFRHLAVAGFACLLAASCTDGMDDADGGNRLPDGKYPMTFTAAVDGLTATRAMTTNGTTSWEASDPVAISMDGGANHKVYKITDTSTGAMSPDDSGSADNTLYWSNTTETLAAWHPVGCSIGSRSGVGEVSITDQSTSFGTLENILYAPATQYTYSSSGNNGSVAFTFRHALAKVKVTLKKEDGKNDFTDEQISNATVRFMGYTTATLGYNGLTVSNDSKNAEIKPKTETVPPSGGGGTSTTTYTALLVPQQMQDKQFIKVSITTNSVERIYYYTPNGDNDANLEAGQQYTYNITVKKEDLQVEPVSASWTDNTPSIDTPEEATLQVHLPESHGQTLTINGITQVESSNVYTISNYGNSFSISYSVTDDNKTKGFLIAKGVVGNCKRTVSGDDTSGYTYTFTYSNIRSDIWLSYTLYSEVGDYYYSDGTWFPTYSSGSSPTCIGIVFKVGAGAGDNVSNYAPGTSFTDNVIRGYVIALQDANSNTLAWSTEQITTGASTSLTAFNGYSNTQSLKACGGDNFETKYPVAYNCVNYNPPASNCSGWYLPSYAQIKALYDVKDNFSSKEGFTPLTSNVDYWTSTETNSSKAYNIYWGNGQSYENTKEQAKRVRAILTF